MNGVDLLMTAQPRADMAHDLAAGITSLALALAVGLLIVIGVWLQEQAKSRHRDAAARARGGCAQGSTRRSTQWE